MMSPPRRKKWSEAEEKTLIDKYGEMISSGDLAKMKTREKKFRPIAVCVNCVHHDRDPVAYPWQWTWKDVSTKVQNMRHQYLLVKQKIKRPELSIEDDSGREEFEWMDGVSYWSNFLRYKDVFGDVPLVFSANDPVTNDQDFDGGSHGMEIVELGFFLQSVDGDEDGDFVTGIGGDDNGVSRLEFDGEARKENCNGSDHLKDDGDDGLVYEEIEGNESESRRKKKESKGLEKKAWGFVASQVRELREMETRFEQCDVERERERKRREQLSYEQEKKSERRMEEMEKEREEREKARKRLRKQWMEEWEAMEKESEARGKRRREEMFIQEREWEERMNRKRSEWMKRMDEMLNHHRAETGQLQSRILHEQQNLVSQLLGIVSQWTGHPGALFDHTSASNHVNGMVHDNTRVEGDNQDDQFMVDG